MRLWSLHPKYLDRQGLLACWRESLLAQSALQGKGKGYLHHPQLIRFKASVNPSAAIAAYLAPLAEEAEKRGYHFNQAKILTRQPAHPIPVTRGQILYEWEHLKGKLAQRDPERLKRLKGIEMPESHPLLVIVPGEVETWEKIQAV